MIFSYHSWESPLQQVALQHVLGFWLNIPLNWIPKGKFQRAEGPGSKSSVRFSSLSRSATPRQQVRSRGPRTPPSLSMFLPSSTLPPSFPASLHLTSYLYPPCPLSLPLSLSPWCHVSFFLIRIPRQMSYTRSLLLDGTEAYHQIVVLFSKSLKTIP